MKKLTAILIVLTAILMPLTVSSAGLTEYHFDVPCVTISVPDNYSVLTNTDPDETLCRDLLGFTLDEAVDYMSDYDVFMYITDMQDYSCNIVYQYLSEYDSYMADLDYKTYEDLVVQSIRESYEGWEIAESGPAVFGERQMVHILSRRDGDTMDIYCSCDDSYYVTVVCFMGSSIASGEMMDFNRHMAEQAASYEADFSVNFEIADTPTLYHDPLTGTKYVVPGGWGEYSGSVDGESCYMVYVNRDYSYIDYFSYDDYGTVPPEELEGADRQEYSEFFIQSERDEHTPTVSIGDYEYFTGNDYEEDGCDMMLYRYDNGYYYSLCLYYATDNSYEDFQKFVQSISFPDNYSSAKSGNNDDYSYSNGDNDDSLIESLSPGLFVVIIFAISTFLKSKKGTKGATSKVPVSAANGTAIKSDSKSAVKPVKPAASAIKSAKPAVPVVKSAKPAASAVKPAKPAASAVKSGANKPSVSAPAKGKSADIFVPTPVISSASHSAEPECEFDTENDERYLYESFFFDDTDQEDDRRI